MSGSDAPSGGLYEGGGGGAANDPCLSLRLRRNLEGPVPGVADGLQVGEVVPIVLIAGDPPIVVVNDVVGTTAGSIVPTFRLLECLQQGIAFEADVLSTDGGFIQLEVRAAR